MRNKFLPVEETHSISFDIGLILTIVFCILKVTRVINWSWVWVFSPIWIWFLLGMLIVAVALVVGVFLLWRDSKNKY